MVSIVIKGGWFHQIIGRSAQNAGFIFIAVLGDLANETQVSTYTCVEKKFVFPLSNYIDEEFTSILLINTHLFTEPVNGVWVRARVPAIFGSNILFSQFVPDYKYGLIEQTFIACEQKSKDECVAYPFICEDYNLYWTNYERHHSRGNFTSIWAYPKPVSPRDSIIPVSDRSLNTRLC